jgi:hypothetical protein
MANPRPQPPIPRERSPLAAFLSYLVPGLGQIYQGRIGKGVLFFVCLYGLFFTGMALGDWKNVYLPDTARGSNSWNLPTPLANIYNRLPFAGQFWIGAAAWPAIWQYLNYDEDKKSGPIFGTFQRTPREGRFLDDPDDEINRVQRDGNKTFDLGWVYTVIAGVLNILVIYDAYAGSAFAEGERREAAQKAAAAA